MKGRAAAAPAAPARRGRRRRPPVLPPPLEHHFLSRHGGQLAEPHVFVKYAARYKGAGESGRARAWPLAGATAADALESEPFDVTEEELATDAPPGLRYAELPVYATGKNGGKASRRRSRSACPPSWRRSSSSTRSREQYAPPGEDAEAFATRLLSAGAGPQEAGSCATAREEEARARERASTSSGRKKETWLSVGGAILRTCRSSSAAPLGVHHGGELGALQEPHGERGRGARGDAARRGFRPRPEGHGTHGRGLPRASRSGRWRR